jgi:hypothetical protein
MFGILLFTLGRILFFDKSLKNEPYGSKVVLQLRVPLLNQGYRIIMDSWFSSPDLFHKLCSKQIDAMGTLCQNRKGAPAEIKGTKLKKGEHISVYKGRLMLMKWKNKKIFVLLVPLMIKWFKLGFKGK